MGRGLLDADGPFVGAKVRISPGWGLGIPENGPPRATGKYTNLRRRQLLPNDLCWDWPIPLRDDRGVGAGDSLLGCPRRLVWQQATQASPRWCMLQVRIRPASDAGAVSGVWDGDY